MLWDGLLALIFFSAAKEEEKYKVFERSDCQFFQIKAGENKSDVDFDFS